MRSSLAEKETSPDQIQMHLIWSPAKFVQTLGSLDLPKTASVVQMINTSGAMHMQAFTCLSHSSLPSCHARLLCRTTSFSQSAGQSSPVYNLPGPFTARSLVYYALLDGLNGSEQYYGAILLKLYEQPDAQGAHK